LLFQQEPSLAAQVVGLQSARTIEAIAGSAR
jgi:hypothetical protein